MPYDGTGYRAEHDPVLGRLTRARARLTDRRHWIAGRYFEEDGGGHHYCILGALSADPADDGCMAQDAVGREATVWLARQICGADMPFADAARVVYNLNDGNAALEALSQSAMGFLFIAGRRKIDGHGRVLGLLDDAIAARRLEIECPVVNAR